MKNKTEQRGFLLLSVLLIAVLLVFLLIPHKSKRMTVDEPLAAAMERFDQNDSIRQVTKSRYYSSRRNKPHSYNHRSEYTYEQREPLSKPDFTKSAEERHPLIVELNEADTLDLQDLYGIGPYFARSIVKYRELLGGYVSKEQLLEVRGMTDDRYQAIVSHIVLDTHDIRKININTADYKTLRRHPYIDNHIAKTIIRLRSSGIHFSKPDDLLKISLVDVETKNRLTPYITFEDDTIHSRPNGPNA